ncbi:MAG: SDR family NAD(P)-dependent oxidoreductase [Bacteroidales bacterium]|nr:SDR family NAD(P)-dependent oxidoreductase [Bacteroidales bacterium]MCF8391627.1 SDR family NAD(P)-dependent oxidoreductase [Bacteroidales bacterium]
MNTNWTIQNIPDLKGKTIIVTGGNSGIGFEAVKEFSTKGAEVISACRNIQKGEQAKAEILVVHPKAKIEVMALDLMDLESIRKFAESFKSKYKKIDVLLNNAGIMMNPYTLTKDGFESQLGTNHLGHFALTGLLIDLIKSTPNSRIVNISSMAHKMGKMNFNNLLFENGKGYTRIKAYGQSKLANLLFTYELQRRLRAANSSSIAVAAHPGISDTNLGRHFENMWLVKIMMPLYLKMVQKADMGALPGIRASVDPNVKGGEYYGPDGKGERTGYPVLVESTPASHNIEDAKKLWEVSEKLTGVKFGI